MAETLGASADKAHNLTADRKALEKFFAKLDKLHDDNESRTGEFAADCKEVFEEASDKLSITRKVLRHEYSRRRSHFKRLKREAEFEDSERENLERVRAALGDLADTPLGRAATGDDDGATAH